MGEFNLPKEEKDNVKNENNEKFNLLDKGWINVVTDYKGATKLVGMKEFFENAHKYIALAGDTPTQDFAVMRFLLAVLHTVFSRYDANGNVYDGIKLDDRGKQINEISGRAAKNYPKALMKTWKDLWNKGKFPDIVNDYLEKWRDRFYLFDDKYPFYQVTRELIRQIDPKYDNVESDTTCIWPSLLNRRVSESGNKIAIFSSKDESNKNHLSNSELVRWLITFQGVSNASDKKSINKIPNKSIGWIYNLGGVYLNSENLFKTTMLNFVIKHNESQFNTAQKPYWELEIEELYKKYLENLPTDNLAELYTDWSRIMYYFIKKPENIGIFRILKTNEINREDNFLEPMTTWKIYNGITTPKKHNPNEYAWRSFGLIINNENRLPGVVDNLTSIKEYISDVKDIHIKCVSAVYDDNSMSRAMIDEVYDSIDLNLEVATDLQEDGWVERINTVVEDTKYVLDIIYKDFLKDIKSLTNVESKKFIDNLMEKVYFELNMPFKNWLSEITYNDNKEKKIYEWLKTLKQIVFRRAENLVKNSGNKEYIGKTNNGSVKNIASSFNIFAARLNEKIN